MKKIIIEIDNLMRKKNWHHNLKSDFTRDETINVLKNMLSWVETMDVYPNERVNIVLKKTKKE